MTAYFPSEAPAPHFILVFGLRTQTPLITSISLLCNVLYRFFTSTLFLSQSQSGGSLGQADREKIIYCSCCNNQEEHRKQDVSHHWPKYQSLGSCVISHIVVTASPASWGWNTFPYFHSSLLILICLSNYKTILMTSVSYFKCDVIWSWAGVFHWVCHHIPLRYFIMLSTKHSVKHVPPPALNNYPNFTITGLPRLFF